MALLKSYSTFVVQTQDTINSIRFDDLQQEIAPLAIQEIAGMTGTPGLMFPGDGFIYDRGTGRLDLENADKREYVGDIGYDTQNGAQTPNMSGFEKPANFYVVADFTYKYLHNDWGTIGSNKTKQTRVYLGDIIEKVSGASQDWRRIPGHIGNHHVYNDFTQYAHISKADPNGMVGGNDTAGVESVVQATGY